MEEVCNPLYIPRAPYLIPFISLTSKVTCLNHAKSTSVQGKLKKVLGVQPHDQPLINYWSTHLH